ncbi:MAG: 23S rRNA (adenine(2503)-C(2))-methyltransferase RlmN [Tannerellaceae bacterium]|jgi:23S rRNA (adenine2503-C2)-methyltransferase|nr:23S rRNA (adenine(2503)-C(2))-methyltransferase RlmN [Tannerellaceae bacterium]
MPETKQPLLGMTLAELREVAAQCKLPSYAAGQISDWLYKKRVATIEEMTNISAAGRSRLHEGYEVGRTAHTLARKSADGTIKYAFPASGSHIETVYIPASDRNTLCVSSQVGCKMSCVFCMTGRNGFTANLTSNGIINQIVSAPESAQITNVVFMGMGEPFDNTDEVMKTLDILTSSYGFGWSPKRITVSTIGAKGLKRFLDESSCNLAVSLHSTYRDDRFSIIPSEKAFPIQQTIALIGKYDFSHQRRVSFEYILFKGFNDSPRHAASLSLLLKGIHCRVNLIAYHHIPDAMLEGVSPERMETFREILSRKGITCTIRTSRGEDIQAACGMLGGNNVRAKQPRKA